MKPGAFTPAKAVARFNYAVSVGAIVIARRPDGATLRLRTRTPAAVIGTHRNARAVIWLQGIVGCFPLEDIEVPAPAKAGRVA